MHAMRTDRVTAPFPLPCSLWLRLSARKAVVCMKGQCLHGGTVSAWKAVVCMEGRCLHEGSVSA